MKLDEFGAKIKSKYPQYANLSDYAVGEKMLEKYPQYKSQIDEPSILTSLYKNTLQPTVEGLKTLPGLLASGGLTAMTELGTKMTDASTKQAVSGALNLRDLNRQIQEGLKRGDDVSQLQAQAKQLASAERGRYNANSAMGDQTVKMSEMAKNIRAKTGLSGSFKDENGNLDLAGGLTTTLKGASAPLAMVDLIALASGAPPVSYIAKRGAANYLTNTGLYGTGSTAQALREGTDPTKAFMRGVSGEQQTGIFEGVTGDKSGVAQGADLVTSLVLPLILNKQIDKATTAIVEAPGKAVTSAKNAIQSKLPGGNKVSGRSPEDLASAYFGSSYQLTKTERRKLDPQNTYKEMVKMGFKGTPAEMAKVSEDINYNIIDPMVKEAINTSNETVNVGSVMDKSRNVINSRPSLFRNKKEVNALVSGLASEFDADQSRGISTISAPKLLQAQKNIAEQAQEYYDAWKRSGNVKDRTLYRFYKAASDESKALMDKLSGNNQLLDQLKPDAIAQVSRYSPVLAERLRKARTVSEVRSLMAPFAKMNEIAKLTVEKINNSGALSSPAARTAMALTLGTSTQNPLIGLLGYLGAPLINPAVNNATARVQSNMAQKIINPDSKFGALFRALGK